MGADSDRELRLRLSRRVRARRDELRLTQEELAEAAGVHVNTIIRMEQAEFASKRGPSWAKVEVPLGWPPDYIEQFLAGELDGAAEAVPARDPAPETDLVARYRRDPGGPGDSADMIHSIVYKVVATVAPGTSLAEFQELEADALEIAARYGIIAARRDDDASDSNSREIPGL